MFIRTLLTKTTAIVKIRSCVDSDAIILGASTIVFSGVFSGVVSGYVTYRLNRSKERSEFLRGKLETLFIAVQQFHLAMAESMFYWIDVTQGKLTYNEAYDKHVTLIDTAPDQYGTIEMLISLYFPELLLPFRTCKDAADQSNIVHGNLKRMADAGKDPSSLFDPYFKSLKEFDAGCKTLKAAIIKLGVRLRVRAKPKRVTSLDS